MGIEQTQPRQQLSRVEDAPERFEALCSQYVSSVEQFEHAVGELAVVAPELAPALTKLRERISEGLFALRSPIRGYDTV